MSCIVLSNAMESRGWLWWIMTSHSGQWMLSSRCLTMQLLQKVWRHSVTVVASTKYPEHILQVIISLIVQIPIFLSPADTAAIAAAVSVIFILQFSENKKWIALEIFLIDRVRFFQDLFLFVISIFYFLRPTGLYHCRVHKTVIHNGPTRVQFHKVQLTCCFSIAIVRPSICSSASWFGKIFLRFCFYNVCRKKKRY